MATAVANGDTVRGLIMKMQDQFSMALPKHISGDRFVRVALTALTKTPRLADCDQASLFGALLTCSQLGIEPDGRRAHLIPFENRQKGIIECQLIIDYKGIAELVMRSGGVSVLHADLVCEHDTFVYDKGEIKTHQIDFRKPRGEPYAVYCLVRMKDGSEKAEVLSVLEINDIRDRFSMSWRAKNNSASPWATAWGEMAKKTVFKRLAKWLPWSPEIRDIIEKDDEADRIIEVQATHRSMLEHIGGGDVTAAAITSAKVTGSVPFPTGDTDDKRATKSSKAKSKTDDTTDEQTDTESEAAKRGAEIVAELRRQIPLVTNENEAQYLAEQINGHGATGELLADEVSELLAELHDAQPHHE